MESTRQPMRTRIFRWAHNRPVARYAVPLFLLSALPLYAQSTGSDPWDNAVNVLKTAFTGTIATGLSLVAIVVGGLMFVYGEGQSKKTLAGIIFGVGMAIGAVKVTDRDLQAIFSKAVGRPISYARFPEEILVKNPDLKQLSESLEHGPLADHVDLDSMREINPEIQSFRSWLAGNGREALEALLK